MTIAIRHLNMPRQHRYIAQGQSVNIIVEVIDAGVQSTLLDPMHIPTLSLFDPNDTQLLNDVEMSYMSKGLYRYTYRTTMSNILGVYTVNVTALNTDDAARLERVSVFKIYRATTLATFTYLIIKDQTGVLWYWFVNTAGELNSVPAIPSSFAKQVSAIPLTPIPSWLQINNPTPAIRYVYPSIAGEVTVTATQPSIGTGNVGSPTFVSVNGISYVISLNISDEVILNTV